MSTWKATIKEHNVGIYEVEVQAPTWNTARVKICDIYCVSEGEVQDLHEVDGWGSSTMGDTNGLLILCAVLFMIWLAVEYWWIVVPLLAIGALGWIADKTQHWWDR